MAKRAGIIRQSSDAGEDNSSKREADNQDVALNTGYERVMKRQAAKQVTARRPDYDSANPTCDGQRPEIKDMDEGLNGFWSFFVPSIENNVVGVQTSNDPKWKKANLDAADKKLRESRDRTEQQIGERTPEQQQQAQETHKHLAETAKQEPKEFDIGRFLFGSIWDDE